MNFPRFFWSPELQLERKKNCWSNQYLSFDKFPKGQYNSEYTGIAGNAVMYFKDQNLKN